MKLIQTQFVVSPEALLETVEKVLAGMVASKEVAESLQEFRKATGLSRAALSKYFAEKVDEGDYDSPLTEGVIGNIENGIRTLQPEEAVIVLGWMLTRFPPEQPAKANPDAKPEAEES